MKDEHKTKAQLIKELHQTRRRLKQVENKKDGLDAAGARQTLQDSEKQYQTLFNSMHDAVLIYGLDKQLIDANKAACKIYGYSRKALLQMALSDVFADTKTKIAKDIQQTKNHPFILTESTHLRKNGKTFVAEVNSRRIRSNGKETIFSIIRDVSDRKQFEKISTEIKFQYQAFFESSEDAIVLHDLKGVLLDMNSKACKLFGYSKKEFLRKTIFDLVPHKSKKTLLATFQAIHKNGNEYRESLRMRKDGTSFPVNSVGRAFTFFGQKIIMNIMKDVTRLKAIQAIMIESEQHYRILYESAGDAILINDVKGRILNVNQSGCNLFGYTKEELLEMTIIDIVPPERKKILRGRKSLIHKPTVKPIEGLRVKKDGTLFPVEVTHREVDYKGQKVSMNIVRDITERKKSEAALKQALKIAEDASRIKSQFLANMSHEIRTPMNGVIGFTDMLMNTELDPDQKDFAETIKRSGESLLSLINDVLDFSKIEAGKMDFEDIEFDPEIIAYDVCDLIRPRIGNKPVELICHIGDDVPAMVIGDPLRFRQILTNLVGNAAKFTERGEIELSVEVKDETEDQILLHLSIRDTGMGIPEDKLEYIFEPFRQVDGSTTRKYGGTGLGLAISKYLSDRMNGKLWAESEMNRGSTFYLTCWLKKTEKKQVPRLPPTSFKGKRILIIDDNDTNLSILTQYLEATGAKVTAYDHGKYVMPALEKAQAENSPFDLCISDIQTPDMSGYDVARLIRTPSSPDPHLLLVALSSLLERDAKKCEHVGFNGFLPKPVRKDRLFQMLERLLVRNDIEEEREKLANESITTQYSIREELKHSVNILLVEDNPVNQKLAATLLTKAGYTVEVANNGQEGVDKFITAPKDFDLIFMDIQMPVLDGFSALKAIRAQGYANIPIIAMTAHAMKGDRENCLANGMDDYIPKPIKRELVFELIEKWVFKRDDFYKTF